MAKDQLEVNLTTAMKDNKKHLYKYIVSKRKAKENLYPLLDVGWNTATKDEEKIEVPTAFFALVFNSKASCSSCTQPPELESSGGEKKEAPTLQGKMVRDLLHHLDRWKSLQPGNIHTRVMRELVEVLTKPLSSISQQSQWTKEVTADWKLASMTPTRRVRKRSQGTASLSVWPQWWKRCMDQIIPSAITCTCRANRGSDSASMGLWRSSPAWLNWSPPMQGNLLSGWGKGCGCCLSRHQ